MFPPDYAGLVAGQNPDEIAEAILKVLAEKSGELIRRHFRSRFTLEQHLISLAGALQNAESDTQFLEVAERTGVPYFKNP